MRAQMDRHLPHPDVTCHHSTLCSFLREEILREVIGSTKPRVTPTSAGPVQVRNPVRLGGAPLRAATDPCCDTGGYTFMETRLRSTGASKLCATSCCATMLFNPPFLTLAVDLAVTTLFLTLTWP